jgi:mannosyltransferase
MEQPIPPGPSQEASRVTRAPLLRPPFSADADPRFPARAALLILLLAAAILRLRDLGDGLWFDEINTLARYVRLPLSQIVTTFGSKNQHLLYSVLAHGSVQLFGESAWALRLPAAIFGVASIAALVWFGRMVTSQLEAFAAAALLTFSYHHVWFSQNARGYSGLLLAALIGSGLLLKMTTAAQSRWPLAIGYAVTMALAMLIHPTAALIVAGHAVWWAALAIRNRRNPAWPAGWLPLAAFSLAGVIALLCYAPGIAALRAALLAPDKGGVTLQWKNPLWFATEALRGLRRGLPGGWFSLAGATVVTMVGLVSYARRSPAIAWLMVLPALMTGVALLASGQNLWPRFFFFSFGFAALIVVRGLYVCAARVWPARASLVGTVATTALIAASATTVPKAWNPKQDYFGAREFVTRSSRAGDAIVTVDMTALPVKEYQGPNWFVAADREQLTQIERAHSRTWILLTFPVRLASIHPDMWDYMQHHYVKAAEFRGTVAGGEIIVMVNR